MLGNRMMAHFENNVLVGSPRLFYLSSGNGSQFVYRTRIPGNTGIRSSQGFRSNILSRRGAFLKLFDNLSVNIITGKDDIHGFAKIKERKA
jgi:hypothetical protein